MHFFLNNHFFQDSDHPRHNEVWDPPRYEAEKAIASPGKGWGFCSEECDKLDSQPSGVKYYGLGLMAYLSDEKCKELLGVNLNIHNILNYKKAIYFSNQNSFCKNSSKIPQPSDSLDKKS